MESYSAETVSDRIDSLKRTGLEQGILAVVSAAAAGSGVALGLNNETFAFYPATALGIFSVLGVANAVKASRQANELSHATPNPDTDFIR